MSALKDFQSLQLEKSVQLLDRHYDRYLRSLDLRSQGRHCEMRMAHFHLSVSQCNSTSTGFSQCAL